MQQESDSEDFCWAWQGCTSRAAAPGVLCNYDHMYLVDTVHVCCLHVCLWSQRFSVLLVHAGLPWLDAKPLWSTLFGRGCSWNRPQICFHANCTCNIMLTCPAVMWSSLLHGSISVCIARIALQIIWSLIKFVAMVHKTLPSLLVYLPNVSSTWHGVPWPKLQSLMHSRALSHCQFWFVMCHGSHLISATHEKVAIPWRLQHMTWYDLIRGW